MAWNQLVAVKRNLVTEFAAIMPVSEETGGAVGVDYSWPGKMQLDEHLWFYGGEHAISDPVIKAGRRYRDIVSSFDLVIEVRRAGATVDPDDGTTDLQSECDERCDYLLGLCDEWIADNPHLGFGPGTSTDNEFTITGSLIEAVRFEHGPTDRGCAALNVARVTYYARIK